MDGEGLRYLQTLYSFDIYILFFKISINFKVFTTKFIQNKQLLKLKLWPYFAKFLTDCFLSIHHRKRDILFVKNDLDFVLQSKFREKKPHKNWKYQCSCNVHQQKTKMTLVVSQTSCKKVEKSTLTVVCFLFLLIFIGLSNFD